MERAAQSTPLPFASRVGAHGTDVVVLAVVMQRNVAAGQRAAASCNSAPVSTH
jgi:hypothetical protein